MEGEAHFMFTKNDNLKAVYSSDLDEFLTKLGCAQEFYSEQLHCRYCGAVISEKNLYAVVPCNNSVEFCCNHSACIISLAEEAK